MTIMDKASIDQSWDRSIDKARGNSQQPQSAYFANNPAGKVRGQTGHSLSAAPVAIRSAADKQWDVAIAKAQGRHGR